MIYLLLCPLGHCVDPTLVPTLVPVFQARGDQALVLWGDHRLMASPLLAGLRIDQLRMLLILRQLRTGVSNRTMRVKTSQKRWITSQRG